MGNRIRKDEAHSLHKYFLAADTLRNHLDSILLKKRRKNLDVLSIVMDRSLSYGLLYAVIEGIERLRIKDTRITRLLKSPTISIY